MDLEAENTFFIEKTFQDFWKYHTAEFSKHHEAEALASKLRLREA